MTFKLLGSAVLVVNYQFHTLASRYFKFDGFKPMVLDYQQQLRFGGMRTGYQQACGNHGTRKGQRKGLKARHDERAQLPRLAKVRLRQMLMRMIRVVNKYFSAFVWRYLRPQETLMAILGLVIANVSFRAVCSNS